MLSDEVNDLANFICLGCNVMALIQNQMEVLYRPETLNVRHPLPCQNESLVGSHGEHSKVVPSTQLRDLLA